MLCQDIVFSDVKDSENFLKAFRSTDRYSRRITVRETSGERRKIEEEDEEEPLNARDDAE